MKLSLIYMQNFSLSLINKINFLIHQPSPSWVFSLKKTQDFEEYGSGFKVIDDKGPKGLFIITASVNEHAW